MTERHDAMVTLDELYFGDLERRINAAFRVYHHAGHLLTRDALNPERLARLDALAVAVDRHMERMGMPQRCTRCGQQARGGCCGAKIANEADAPLLLINLFAGYATEHRPNGSECGFLGDTGCTLRYKPFLCLNYLCLDIRREATADELAELSRRTGRLLSALVAAEQRVLEVLRGVGLLR